MRLHLQRKPLKRGERRERVSTLNCARSLTGVSLTFVSYSTKKCFLLTSPLLNRAEGPKTTSTGILEQNNTSRLIFSKGETRFGKRDISRMPLIPQRAKQRHCTKVFHQLYLKRIYSRRFRARKLRLSECSLKRHRDR